MLRRFPFILSAPLDRFLANDKLHATTGHAGLNPGVAKPTRAYRRALQQWAMDTNDNNNSNDNSAFASSSSSRKRGKASRASYQVATHAPSYSSILSPKHFKLYEKHQEQFWDRKQQQQQQDSLFEQESFDGVQYEDRQLLKRYELRSEEQEDHDQQLSKKKKHSEKSLYRMKVKEILQNPEDDPTIYPPDSWERERAAIRRRAKISLIEKEEFRKNFEIRAEMDERKFGVEHPSTTWSNISTAGKKEERWLKRAKQLGLFETPEGEDEQPQHPHTHMMNSQEAERENDNEDSFSSKLNFREGSDEDDDEGEAAFKLVDMDERIKQEQLSRRSAEESHLTPEQVAIRYYNDRVVQGRSGGGSQDGADYFDRMMMNESDTADRDLRHQEEGDEMDDDYSSSQKQQQHKEEEDNSHTVVMDQIQSRRNVNKSAPTRPEEAESPEAFFKLQRRRNPRKFHPSENDVLSNQDRFDELLERALVLFSPPQRDALSTVEVSIALKRANPDFRPSHYGSPELTFLLRNSSFLMNFKGKWTFVRVYDAERNNNNQRGELAEDEDVTIKLERYKYREAPAQDGVRSIPFEKVNPRKASWT